MSLKLFFHLNNAILTIYSMKFKFYNAFPSPFRRGLKHSMPQQHLYPTHLFHMF